MKKFAALFTDSAREFKNVRTLTMCGLLAALAFVIKSFSIQLGPYIEIGFSGIPNEIVDFLFGPTVGAFFSAAMDVFKWIVKPSGPFMPGFTLNALLAGLIYGIFLYKKPIRLWRILTAKLIVSLFINVGLATLWLSMMYGQGFIALLPDRILKNVIMWPVNSLITYLILKALEGTGIFRLFGIYKSGSKQTSDAKQ